MNSKRKEQDRFSNLPDSILLNILSFLPTQDAVRTMLVNKPFTTLWTLLPSLDFEDWCFPFPDDEDDDTNDVGNGDIPFFAFVRNVLMCHKRPTIDKFRVDITTMFYSDIEERNLGHELESCISFALRKQVKVLELIFGMVEPDELLFKWPLSEFRSDSLVELRLEFLSLTSITRVQLSSLRILKLIRMDVTESVLEEFIRGCPLLKELEIYNCFDVSNLSFVATNVENLSLDISDFSYYSSDDDDFGHLVKINCPNLQRFDFTGFADCLEIMNISSVAEVTFDLRCRRLEFKEFQRFLTVLKMLVFAERVSFSCEFVTVMFYCLLKDVPELSINWKRAEFSIWLTDNHIHGLNCMLRNSPHLEELVVDVANWHSDFIEPIESQLGDDMLYGEDNWRSLKSITIHNIANSSYAVLVRLTELLLKKASVLEELLFYYKIKDHQSAEGTYKLTSKQLTKFSLKLPEFSRASQHVKILVH